MKPIKLICIWVALLAVTANIASAAAETAQKNDFADEQDH